MRTLLAMMLVACGTHDVLEPTNATVIEASPDIAYAVELFQDTYGSAFGDYRLIVATEAAVFDCSGTLTDGCHRATKGASSIRIVAAPCLGDTALAHELGHAIRAANGLDTDGDHSDADHWQRVKAAERRIISEMCPR